jgi:hypothetical protein
MGCGVHRRRDRELTSLYTERHESGASHHLNHSAADITLLVESPRLLGGGGAGTHPPSEETSRERAERNVGHAELGEFEGTQTPLAQPSVPPPLRMWH